MSSTTERDRKLQQHQQHKPDVKSSDSEPEHRSSTHEPELCSPLSLQYHHQPSIEDKGLVSWWLTGLKAPSIEDKGLVSWWLTGLKAPTN